MFGLSPLTVFTMRILSCDGLTVLNPLGPNSDQHQISPINIPVCIYVIMRKRMGTTNENLNFNITIQRIIMWQGRLVLALNGLRSSPRKSISNSRDTRTWRTCHFQDAIHFNLGNRERLTVPYLYTGILIFWHLVGKSLQTSKVIELALR